MKQAIARSTAMTRMTTRIGITMWSELDVDWLLPGSGAVEVSVVDVLFSFESVT